MDNKNTNKEKNTESKILQAAAVIFERDGFSGARMQAIADLAGINKALLHYYFRSKELLFKRIFLEKFAVFFKDMVKLLDTETDFFIRVDMFVDAYMKMLLSNPDLPIMLLTSIHQNPEFMKHLDPEFGPKVLDIFKKEMDKGRIVKVQPLHIITTIVGLCVMPFLARPLARGVFHIPAETYQGVLEERGAFVKHTLRNMLRPS